MLQIGSIGVVSRLASDKRGSLILLWVIGIDVTFIFNFFVAENLNEHDFSDFFFRKKPRKKPNIDDIFFSKRI